jgi:hypothetical protein
MPPIPGVAASPVFVSPILCSPEGTPFVDYPQMPEFRAHTIYELDPKGARSFSPDSAPGLYDVVYLNFFVGESVVVFLVDATKDAAQSADAYNPLPGTNAKPVKRYIGEHHGYLVKFGRDGSYQSTVELPDTFEFRRVGVLADGSFLALGFRRANSEARLLVLDSGGQIVRALQLPSKMLDSPDLTQGQTGSDVSSALAATSLSSWLFAPSRSRILLYQAHSGSPILEVGAGGATREVPLQAPRGYELDGIVPANDRWVVRYRRKSGSSSGRMQAQLGSGDYALYEVLPGDGSLRARIDPGDGPIHNISCEQDGVFTAFSMDKDKVVRTTAELGR